MEHPEEMAAFFNRVADEYEERHLGAISEGMEAKNGISTLLPKNARQILDLGAGTGLELDALFQAFPDAEVTAVDIARSMLDKLEERYAGRSIRVVASDYLKLDLGNEAYDAVITSMTMHHWLPEEKEELYARIWKALRPGGTYIENDYLLNAGTPAENEAEAVRLIEERRQFDRAQPGALHAHLDAPLTVPMEMGILEGAGFVDVREAWQARNNVTLTARRPQ